MLDHLQNYAVYSYEKLRLLQPQIKTTGIYKLGNEYIIHCDNPNLLAIDGNGKSVKEVFDYEIRVAGCPVSMSNVIPKDGYRINERSQTEIINLKGNPFNTFDLNKQLSLLLPSKYPLFWLVYNQNNQVLDVKVKRELSREEQGLFELSIHKLIGENTNINFIYEPSLNIPVQESKHDRLSISVSKFSNQSFSKDLMEKWENDEQIWSDNKEKLFTESTNDKTHSSQKEKQSRCLINGEMATAYNIRNYLTLFDELQIILPIESKYMEFINALGVTEEELIKLIELGKVKLILPHSIIRYKTGILEKAVAINPSSIMLSRELASESIEDLKIRNPLLFVPNSQEEKQIILKELLAMASKMNNEGAWLNGLVKELSNSWSSMHELLSVRGALATFNVGLGPILSSIIKNLTGKDYFLEIMQASNSIEWAAATGAVLCPSGPLAANEENLAFLYSGVKQDWKLEIETSPNIATGKLLTIAQHVPVVDLAQTFTGSEVKRFRALLGDLTHNKTPQEINVIVSNFNESVKQYERNNRRLDSWDVKGVGLDLTQEIVNTAIPFSGFVTKQIGRVIEKAGERYESVGKVVDNIQSKFNRTSPNIVLVSKMKDKVKDLL
ncbi:hypothetical protein SOP93_24730 [Peribacillus frigoritolerans]|uniref:hypothetical protein n=1 Tax=Peribacillus frigoritolerans TaxID=450367 RepID=UPI002B24493F|nr:hypothetical protein [Peribacillus frigoritolerans]MEB2494307.1 hypothetical protein [Peribacillus frigoritolerans]